MTGEILINTAKTFWKQQGIQMQTTPEPEQNNNIH